MAAIELKSGFFWMASVSGAYQRHIEPALDRAGLLAHVSVSAPDSVPLPLFELAESTAAPSETCLGS